MDEIWTQKFEGFNVKDTAEGQASWLAQVSQETAIVMINEETHRQRCISGSLTPEACDAILKLSFSESVSNAYSFIGDYCVGFKTEIEDGPYPTANISVYYCTGGGGAAEVVQTLSGASAYALTYRAAYPYYGSYLGYFKTTYNGGNYSCLAVFDSLGASAQYVGYCLDDVADYGAFIVRNFNSSFGYASTTEGYEGGTFDDSSDLIDIPTKPAVGFTNIFSGNLYIVRPYELQSFIRELFPPVPQPLVTHDNPLDYLEDLAEAMVFLKDTFLNSKLVDYVLDCYLLPVRGHTSESSNITVAYKQFSQACEVVDDDYIDVDCGALEIGEYYASFLDYTATRARLYLPFCGFVNIEPEYFQSGKLQVKYRFNVVDGSCMAWVISTSSKSKLENSVIGQYSGSCAVHFPFTGLNYSTMLSGLTSTAITAATGGAGAAAAAVSTAISASQMRPQMQGNNNYNSNTTFLGIRTPYLIIERADADYSQNYNNEQGLPLNVTMKLSEVTGYTEFSKIHVDNIVNAEASEVDEIQNLLISGVIL